MDATPTAFLCMLAKVFSYFHLNANSDELTSLLLSVSLTSHRRKRSKLVQFFKVVFSSDSPGFLKVIQ